LTIHLKIKKTNFVSGHSVGECSNTDTVMPDSIMPQTTMIDTTLAIVAGLLHGWGTTIKFENVRALQRASGTLEK